MRIINNRTLKIIGSAFFILIICLLSITASNYFNKKSNNYSSFEFKEVAYSNINSKVKKVYETINSKPKQKIVITDSQNKTIYLILTNIPIKEVTSNIELKSNNTNEAAANFNIQGKQKYAENEIPLRVYKLTYSVSKLNFINILIDNKVVPIDISIPL